MCVKVGVPQSSSGKSDIRTFLASSGPGRRPCSCCESSQPSIWAMKQVVKSTLPGEGCDRGRLPVLRPTRLLELRARALFRAIRCLASGAELILNRETSTYLTPGSSPPGRENGRLFSHETCLECILQVRICTVSGAEKQRKDKHLHFHSCRLKRKS